MFYKMSFKLPVDSTASLFILVESFRRMIYFVPILSIYIQVE